MSQPVEYQLPRPLRSVPPAEATTHIPEGGTFLRILGVNYFHFTTRDEGDLYLTELGLPFNRHIQPENWIERPWFSDHAVRLEGTSTVYRIPTRPIDNHLRKSLMLVVKWSRVGEDIPLTTFTLDRMINADFNTPFEEFSLLTDLRTSRPAPGATRLLTQKPLGIYVPPERMQLWQSGRSMSRIKAKIAAHPGIELDVLRSYIMIYAWVNGHNAVDGFGRLSHSSDDVRSRQQLADFTREAEGELRQRGFRVADHKPTHLIVRIRDGQVRRRRDGRVAYALVDYELLQRTPEYEDLVRARRRSEYLLRQRDRFSEEHLSHSLPPGLKRANILGVDYIHGTTESTGGVLWVVGRDPELFSYFLPERWRMKHTRLSPTNQTYYTQSKDRVHLVWKVSRVGEIPPGDLSEPRCREHVRQGYNAPFEEFAIALALQRAGVPTIYPRAIYVTAAHEDCRAHVLDDRRFKRYAELRSPDGLPVLPIDQEYVCIWGFYRGQTDAEACETATAWNPIDAATALARGLIDRATQTQLLREHADRLADAGYEDTALCPAHVLLSFIPPATLQRDLLGRINTLQCNFTMVRATQAGR